MHNTTALNIKYINLHFNEMYRYKLKSAVHGIMHKSQKKTIFHKYYLRVSAEIITSLVLPGNACIQLVSLSNFIDENYRPDLGIATASM